MLNDTALPASLSAVHLGLAMLRRHRAGGPGVLNPFVLPSFLFPALPWVWASLPALGLGVVAHLLWLALAETLAPPVRRRVTSSPVAATSQLAASVVAATSGPPPSIPAAAPRRGFQPTTVLAVLDESSDIKTLRLARPDGFEFQPGQFLPVRVHIDGKPHVRCYSISSAPHTSGYLEISVRRQGLVSGTLHATMRAGAALPINRPAGQFVYPAGDDRPIALVAGGIGITPLLSMLRHAVASEPTRPITLLYSARRAHDVAFLSDLRVLADRHPQVRVALTLTQASAPPPSNEDLRWRHGRIDAAMIRQFVPSPADTIFCMCGPRAMLAEMTTRLADIGVPTSQIRFEHFETAVAASLVNPAAESARADHATVLAGADRYTVTFAASGRAGTATADMTLLDAADAEGVVIRSSCRSGVCQSCRTHLKEGGADCRSDVLDPSDREAGYVLPCVTWATSDCVLDA